MLVKNIDFQEKIEKEHGITKDQLLGIFNNMTEDLKFLSDIEAGYSTFISLNPQKGDLGVFNIKEEGPGLAFINQQHTLVVRAFDYLREVLAH